MVEFSFFDSAEFDKTMKELASLPSSLSGTPGPGPSPTPKPSFSQAQVEAFTPTNQGIPEQAPQMGFLEGAAHDIWTGMKGGVFSQARGVDNLINILAGKTGQDRQEISEALLKDIISAPTPQDVRAGLKSMVLRGLGGAIPIIAEFAIGTKGVGLAMKGLGVPGAIKLGSKALPLAAPAYFGAREGGTSLAESIVQEEPMGRAIPKAMARGAGGVALGGTLGLTHGLPLPAKMPIVGGAFGTQAAVEGALSPEGINPEEVISSTLVGFGLSGPELLGKGIGMAKKIRARAPHEGPEPTKVRVVTKDGVEMEVYPQAIEALRSVLRGRDIENVEVLDFATLQKAVDNLNVQPIGKDIRKEHFPGGRAYEQWVKSMERDAGSKVETPVRAADKEVAIVSTAQTEKKAQEQTTLLGVKTSDLQPKFDEVLGIFKGLADKGVLEKDVDGSYLIPDDLFRATWKSRGIPETDVEGKPTLPGLQKMVAEDPTHKFGFYITEAKGLLNQPLDPIKYGLEDSKDIDVTLDAKGMPKISVKAKPAEPVKPAEPAKPTAPQPSPFDEKGNRVERVVSEKPLPPLTEVEEAKGATYTKKEARPDLNLVQKLTREITTLEEAVKKAKSKMGLEKPTKGAIANLADKNRVKADSDRRAALDTISRKRVELEAAKSRLLGYIGLTDTTLPKDMWTKIINTETGQTVETLEKLVDAVNWKIVQEKGKKIKGEKIAPVVAEEDIGTQVELTQGAIEDARVEFGRLSKAIAMARTSDPSKIPQLETARANLTQELKWMQDDLDTLLAGKPLNLRDAKGREVKGIAAQKKDLKDAAEDLRKFQDSETETRRKVEEFQSKKEPITPEEVTITWEEALKAAGGDEDVAREMMKPAFGKGNVGAAEMGPEGPKKEYAIDRSAVAVTREELESKMREIGFRLTKELGLEEHKVLVFSDAPQFEKKVLKLKLQTPEGQRWRQVTVDLSDGAWEIRSEATRAVLNSSLVSDAPAVTLPDMLRRTVRPASDIEKAKMEVKEVTRLPKDAPPFKTAAQASALVQNLRKKGQNATIVTVDIPKASPRDKPQTGYYVEVVETGTAGEAALGKILAPEKGKAKGEEVTITVDTPNGPVTITLNYSAKDADTIARALGGSVVKEAGAASEKISGKGAEALAKILEGEPFEKPGTPPPGSRKVITPEDLEQYLTPKAAEAEIPTEKLDKIVDDALAGSSDKTAKLKDLDKVMSLTNRKLQALLDEHKAQVATQKGGVIGGTFQPRIDELNTQIQAGLKEQGLYLESYRKLAGTDFGGSAAKGVPRYEGDIDVIDAMGKPFKAAIFSTGYEGGSRYYVMQGADGMAPQIGVPGNVLAAKAWIREGKKDKKPTLILDGWTGDTLPNDAQDALLNVILEKNMSGENPRAVHKKSGVADDAWDRRSDKGYDDAYQARVRRIMALEDLTERVKGGTELVTDYKEALARKGQVEKKLGKKPGDEALLEELLREETLVDSIKTMMAAEAEKGPIVWTKGQRLEYLRAAMGLNDSIDQSLQDIDYAKAGTGTPKMEDMTRIVDRFGDPSRVKHPTMRRIAVYGQQYELGYRKALLQYARLIDQGIGYLVKDNPEKNKELMMHLHKVIVTEDLRKSFPDQKLGAEFVSKDPKIVQAANFHKTVFEDLARRFELDKKGLYVPDYATIRYDMDKIWKYFGGRLAAASDYKELPNSVLGSIRPSHWTDLKRLADKYIGTKWEEIPREDRTFLNDHLLKWGGAFNEWEFLPKDLQQMITKEKWVANFQHRTAGDRYKFALSEDYFGTTMQYLNVTLRGALYNDFLAKANPLLRTLPFKNQPGTWGKFAQDYVERLGGYGPESWSDLKWNAMADRLNQMLGTSKIPMYLPKEAVGLYREALYRGALGPDTALRNLTQTMFTWAEDGTMPVLKGMIKFVYGAATKTPEYLKYKETRDLLEDSFYLEMQGLRKSNSKAYERIKDLNHRLTWLVLSPLRFTENFNKGVAYFSGLEAAMKKGVDFRTAHLIGSRNASTFETTNLERTELEWQAWQKMGSSQFLYGKATTSPYMQSNIAASFMPFMSFPAKSIQMFTNGFKESWMAKDWMRLSRFVAVAGFMAAAPAFLATTLGIDAFAVWGKGALPIDVMPMWYNTMRDIYTGAGGSDSDNFMSKELARTRVKESLLMLLIPQYRWLRKTGAPYEAGLTDIKGSWQRIDDKYTRWGRTESPLTDTTTFAEFMHVFGWPFADKREGRMWLREAKDVDAEYRLNKSKAIRRILDLRNDDKSQAATNAMAMAKAQGIRITGEDLATAMRNRKVDAYTLQAKRMPKPLQGEWRKRALAMRKKQLDRGTRSMWGGERETDMEGEE